MIDDGKKIEAILSAADALNAALTGLPDNHMIISDNIPELVSKVDGKWGAFEPQISIAVFKCLGRPKSAQNQRITLPQGVA